ncbi:MAG TPA: DUF4386 domain-containing protein [Candidatus Angelobacter sp.]|jgi:hypothetical protein
MSVKPQMKMGGIEPAQYAAAKAAGFLYLFLMASALFAEFYVRRRLIVPNDALHTATNVAAHEQLFRLGIGADLITFAGDIALIWALYVILKPVQRNIALLAAFWRLAECSILATVILNDLAALRLLSGAGYLEAFSQTQLQALTSLFLDMEISGYRIGAVFFALGSLLFSYLWFKSRYIPRALAVWGILSSLLPLFVASSVLVFPFEEFYGQIRRGRTGIPMVIFEIILGFWLLTKGIKAPITDKREE